MRCYIGLSHYVNILFHYFKKWSPLYWLTISFYFHLLNALVFQDMLLFLDISLSHEILFWCSFSLFRHNNFILRVVVWVFFFIFQDIVSVNCIVMSVIFLFQNIMQVISSYWNNTVLQYDFIIFLRLCHYFKLKSNLKISSHYSEWITL